MPMEVLAFDLAVRHPLLACDRLELIQTAEPELAAYLRKFAAENRERCQLVAARATRRW